MIHLICPSPLGKLSPGASDINDALLSMWDEAEANRQKWGCKSHNAFMVCPVL